MTWGNWQNVDDNQPSSLMVFVECLALQVCVCVCVCVLYVCMFSSLACLDGRATSN